MHNWEPTGMGAIVVGVCYKLLHQEEQVNEAVYRKLEVTLYSQMLVLMQNINHSNICWSLKKELLGDHWWQHLTKVIEEPVRGGGLLHLILTNKKGLAGDAKAKGSVGAVTKKWWSLGNKRGGSRTKKQDHDSELQKSRLELLQGTAWRIPMG